MALGPLADTAVKDAPAATLDSIRRLAVTDFPGAIALALAARAVGVSDPLVHHLVAIDLKGSGRFEEAIVEAGLALESEPQNVELIVLVGFCLLELGRREEAARMFGVAAKLDPTSADAAFGYGWAAERLGALEAAESHFRRAVDLKPDHADALAGLAGLAVRKRQWESARVHAVKAAALDPLQTDALMHLARIDLGSSNFTGAEARLRDLIDLSHLKPVARANAWIMLGDALDGDGRPAEAFEAYATGKTALRDEYADTFEPAGARSATDGVRAILAEFQQTPAAAWAKPPGPAPRGEERGHAFLLGFPRSGTTLMEQVLATHPDITTLEERPALLDAEVEFLTQAGGVTRLAEVTPALLEPFRESYWRRVREFGVETRGKLFVDKQPLNTFRLPLIAKIFPGAKIIFALRDPRDVVLSCFRRSFNMNASMYQFNTLEGAARYYDAVMRAGQVYVDVLPVERHTVRYESLVKDFTGTGKALCDFLGVAWTDRLKDFAETAHARAIATPSSTQVGRGLYDEGIDQWRRYAFALEPIMPILEPWIERFGYGA
jgi:Flp pilus assembly protein TadD